MKFLKTFEASRTLSQNYRIVGSALCVKVSKKCKVFTFGKKYDIYASITLNQYKAKNFNVLNEYKIYNDINNYTAIWRKSNDDLEGEYSTSAYTAVFSIIDDTIEDYETRVNAKKYNL